MTTFKPPDLDELHAAAHSNKRMRDELGGGYVAALRGTWIEVPESADFVMYWWQRAAAIARAGNLRRFGLITTNSIRQTFNRRVLETHLAAKEPLSLLFALPDHPWVDTVDGAAVRIAMTTGQLGTMEGTLATVTFETPTNEGEVSVEIESRTGRIHADLTIGIDMGSTKSLLANEWLSSPGVKLHGAGFTVTREKANALGLDSVAGLGQHIRVYRNGRDLTDVPRNLLVIDLFGLTSDQVRRNFPAVYQWVLERVKPERDQNSRESYREKWWLFGEPRKEIRPALAQLGRFVVTPVTSKHRFFVFLDVAILPDDALMVIATDDAQCLGVLSSRTHVAWVLAAGSTLEDRPRYIKSRCFDPFPFPAATPDQQSRIRALAEELDAHRKRQQAQHADLTLTGMYNVLEKLKSGEALTAKEQKIHADGLVSVLKTLHDEIDLSVLDAYGWSDLAPLIEVVNGNAAPGSDGTAPTRDECRRTLDDALLTRLVALNAERAAEEARGLVRWLRPEYQNPGGTTAAARPDQGALDVGREPETGGERATSDARRPWPKDLADQIRAVAQVLADTRAPLPEAAIAARFTGRGPWKRRLPQLLDTLVAVGRARPTEGGYIGTS